MQKCVVKNQFRFLIECGVPVLKFVMISDSTVSYTLFLVKHKSDTRFLNQVLFNHTVLYVNGICTVLLSDHEVDSLLAGPVDSSVEICLVKGRHRYGSDPLTTKMHRVRLIRYSTGTSPLRLLST
jgi:hypothetical protein